MSSTNALDSAYYIYGSFCFCMFVFVWFFVPETKGISLEKMDELFGVVQGSSKEMDIEEANRNDSNVGTAGDKADITISQIEKK